MPFPMPPLLLRLPAAAGAVPLLLLLSPRASNSLLLNPSPLSPAHHHHRAAAVPASAAAASVRLGAAATSSSSPSSSSGSDDPSVLLDAYASHWEGLLESERRNAIEEFARQQKNARSSRRRPIVSGSSVVGATATPFETEETDESLYGEKVVRVSTNALRREGGVTSSGGGAGAPPSQRLRDVFSRGDVLVLSPDDEGGRDTDGFAFGWDDAPARIKFDPRECCVIDVGDDWLTVGVGPNWPSGLREAARRTRWSGSSLRVRLERVAAPEGPLLARRDALRLTREGRAGEVAALLAETFFSSPSPGGAQFEAKASGLPSRFVHDSTQQQQKQPSGSLESAIQRSIVEARKSALRSVQMDVSQDRAIAWALERRVSLVRAGPSSGGTTGSGTSSCFAALLVSAATRLRVVGGAWAAPAPPPPPRVLAVAPTNAAADVLFGALSEIGVPAVRAGARPAAVSPAVRDHTVAALAERDPGVVALRAAAQNVTAAVRSAAMDDIRRCVGGVSRMISTETAVVVTSCIGAHQLLSMEEDGLKGSGGGMGSDNEIDPSFPIVVVVNADQTTEPELLCALAAAGGPEQVVLVGGTSQQPPPPLGASSVMARLETSGVGVVNLPEGPAVPKKKEAVFSATANTAPPASVAAAVSTAAVAPGDDGTAVDLVARGGRGATGASYVDALSEYLDSIAERQRLKERDGRISEEEQAGAATDADTRRLEEEEECTREKQELPDQKEKGKMEFVAAKMIEEEKRIRAPMAPKLIGSNIVEVKNNVESGSDAVNNQGNQGSKGYELKKNGLRLRRRSFVLGGVGAIGLCVQMILSEQAVADAAKKAMEERVAAEAARKAEEERAAAEAAARKAEEEQVAAAAARKAEQVRAAAAAAKRAEEERAAAEAAARKAEQVRAVAAAAKRAEEERAEEAEAKRREEGKAAAVSAAKSNIATTSKAVVAKLANDAAEVDTNNGIVAAAAAATALFAAAVSSFLSTSSSDDGGTRSRKTEIAKNAKGERINGQGIPRNSIADVRVARQGEAPQSKSAGAQNKSMKKAWFDQMVEQQKREDAIMGSSDVMMGPGMGLAQVATYALETTAQTLERNPSIQIPVNERAALVNAMERATRALKIGSGKAGGQTDSWKLRPYRSTNLTRNNPKFRNGQDGAARQGGAFQTESVDEYNTVSIPGIVPQNYIDKLRYQRQQMMGLAQQATHTLETIARTLEQNPSIQIPLNEKAALINAMKRTMDALAKSGVSN